jgi:hypothetical protein
MFIENVRQIRIIVGDFQPQGQNVLNQKMWVIVNAFCMDFSINRISFYSLTQPFFMWIQLKDN